eukprot:TRINITY_DN2230_c0_g1_i1.p1 TRINITY_DN2230_c0_g1~~TRINITY_DN2230_c0_g1_i1.p1  ORF type:complete len:527 (+),score=132.37 TRINITY_DN2230_c0_g1_i1:143-1723(+)
MFLSKDFLDDNGGGRAGTGGFDGRGTPSTSSGFDDPSRPSTSYGHPGRPGSAAGSRPGAGFDEGDEVEQATPTNAATLRQKMLQQRQRALQKQRTTGSVTAQSNMVMASQSVPMASPSPTAGLNNRGSPTNYGGGAAMLGRPPTSSSLMGSGLDPEMGGGAHGGLGRSLSGAAPSPHSVAGVAMLERADTAMSLAEKEEGIVMPDPSTPGGNADAKEVEAKRRADLAQDLDDRGIMPVYDPTPEEGAGGRGGRVQFDMSTLSPPEMKNFLLNPSPKNYGMIECRIIRERSGLNKLFPKYILESDSGVFMMTAKKQKHNKTSNYSITMSKVDSGKDSETYLGKLRSNFLGLEFVAYSEGLNPKKIDSSMPQQHMMQAARQEFLAVQYSSSLWGGSKPRGPRKMSCVIPHVQPNGERLVCRTLNPDTEGLIALQKAGGSANHLIQSYHNKPPKWNEQIGAFVLNFNKRVTQASVKNFQLTNAEDPDTIYLQFGRVGKDVFNMDFRYPFSPFQAFAICLSSFDYKLCCE